MKNRRRIRDKTNDERINICNNDVNEVQIENNWRSKALHKGKRRNKVMSWINCCVTHIQNSCSNGIAEFKIYHTANRPQVNYIDPIGDCNRQVFQIVDLKKCCCNNMQLLQVWDVSSEANVNFLLKSFFYLSHDLSHLS